MIMTTKSTLKETEWDLLKTSPQWVEAMLTSYRAGGGLVGKRYQHILDKVLSEYKTTNPLVKEVLDYNRNPQVDSSTTQDQARQKLEQIGALLDKQVDPPDAEAVREFLLTIGQKFAEETGEGLFGLGSDVSKKEVSILDSVRTALKATDADQQQRAAAARQAAEAKAKAEAETRAAEEARKKQEAEAKAKAEVEAKAAEETRQKQEAEAKAKAEAEARAKAEAEAKAAEEARQKQEAEAKAEAQAKAKAEAEAKAAEAARQKQEAEAKAKAEAEAKAAEARKKQEADTKPTMAVPKAEPAKTEPKPATAPTPVQAAAARIYEVKSGDSLSKIALEVYGNAGRWPEIFEANKDQIKNPNMIHPGQKLRIP